MLNTDNVVKLRRSIATCIEWTLRKNLPIQRLQAMAEDVHGRTKLSNLMKETQTSTISKPRVLREAASG